MDVVGARARYIKSVNREASLVSVIVIVSVTEDYWDFSVMLALSHSRSNSKQASPAPTFMSKETEEFRALDICFVSVRLD